MCTSEGFGLELAEVLLAVLVSADVSADAPCESPGKLIGGPEGGGVSVADESPELESGGTGFAPLERKMPMSPPETARAGGVCVEACVSALPGESVSVTRFPSAWSW